MTSKHWIAFVIGAVLVISGVTYWVMNSSSQNPESPPPATHTEESSSSQSQAETPAPPPASTSEAAAAVEIRNFAFAPKTLQIKVGTTVTWTNQDSARHDVASDNDSAEKGLASPLLGQAETWSFTFSKPGVYKYHCSPHPYMMATIEVTQ